MAEDLLDAPWSRCLHKPAKPCEVCLAVVLCSHCMRLHKAPDHSPPHETTGSRVDVSCMTSSGVVSVGLLSPPVFSWAQFSARLQTSAVSVARQDLPPLSGFSHRCRCVIPSAITTHASRSNVVPGGLKL
jgi:hypothetical protein